jgi:hypothetical protein
MNDDLISRNEAIDEVKRLADVAWANWKETRISANTMINALKDLPSAQPEINCSEIPNTSDFVSRKAVRDMVATWSYDMAEWEDMELALHDVDELPPVSAERQRGKENE